MCDYSLHDVNTRPAKVGDKLTTRFFKSGTRGFCAPEDVSVAVCVLPGTELSFTDDVRRERMWPWSKGTIKHRTAIFRQVNKEVPSTHHDALEFPDGTIALLTFLKPTDAGIARRRQGASTERGKGLGNRSLGQEKKKSRLEISGL
jgi:hypothetical protein